MATTLIQDENLQDGNSQEYQRFQKSMQQRTVSNILYLLLSFPLGLIYFVLVIVGLSVGVSTIIIWVGIPILLLTMLVIRGIAALERDLAVGLLHVEIPRAAYRERGSTRWMQWFSAQFRDLATWKSLIYLLIKFPLSVISFSLTLPLLLTPIALIFAPLGYIIATSILQMNGIHTESNVPDWLQPFVFNITGQFVGSDFAKAFICTAVGIVLWFVARYLINGLAYLSGELARVFLGATE